MKNTLPQLKYFARDPVRASIEIASSITDLNLKKNVLSIASEVNKIVEANRELEIAKGKISREIGKKKVTGEIPPELLSEIQSITKNIKSNENLIKKGFEDIYSTIPDSDKPADTLSSKSSLKKVPEHFKIAETGEPQNSDLITIDSSFSNDEWANYTANHRNSTIYHDIKWRELLKKRVHHKEYYLVARDAQKNVRGILPAMHLNSTIFGSFLVSMPYFNYGGPLADTPEIGEKLVQHLSAVAHDIGCAHAEIRETHLRSGWPVRTEKVSMILELPESADALSKNLGAKLRSQVRIAEKSGAQFSFGKMELLDNFYSVYSRNMRDLGSPCYNKSFFASILEQFPNSAHVAAVTLNGKAVACGFLLSNRDMLEIPWASSLKKANKSNVNMFMYKCILEEAIAREFMFFDFGRSTTNSTTYRFKKQWGATPYNLYWHYWLANENAIPRLNPDNPKFKLVIKLWQKMPVFLTNIIGPKIAKNLP